ncbi:MAG: cytochrome b [Gammaproteobacteria bacterium]|nr:MAG: cytochrome b [Gammaproteobacteria bacterium]
MLKDSRAGYGLITIIFHWVSAPLIIFLFGLGVYMRGLDYYSPWYHRGPEIHVAIGILVFAIMFLRLFWRFLSTSPDAIPSISKPTLLAASAAKMALYAFVFVICISGYLITTAEGSAASFFGIINIPATLELSSSNTDLAGAIHKYLAWALMGVVIIHAAAALVHHFVKRDKTLTRIIKPVSQVE